jgi:hypothetical protein
MSLVTPFRLGCLPSLAGIRFNGDELLARLQPADAELKPALEALAAKLNARGRETIEMVLECEQLAAGLGQPSPGRPRTPDEYRAWAQRVAAIGHDAFGKQVAGSSTLVLGLNYGDVILSLVLESFVTELIVAAPAHPFLTAQAAALAEGAKQGLGSLALATRAVGLPAAAAPTLEHIEERARLAESSGERAGLATELLARRPDLEAALA